MTYLTKEEIEDVEDHEEREFGREESEEPLGGKHVGLEAVVQEVLRQVWQHVLQHTDIYY